MVAESDVLVVGAGPTGLLLSAELCRRGVECRLIDAHSAPLHWDRATVVHPRTMEVFEALGIVEPLLEAGVKQHVVQLYSAGSALGELDLSLCGSRFGFNLGVSEEVTESILTAHLREQGGEVVRSTKLVGLEEQEDGVVATLQREGATERIRARWVVGCDGYHSATRALSGIELVGHDIQVPWAVFDATVAGWPESYEAAYAYLDEVPVILTSLPGQRWRVYLRPSAPDSDLVADAAATLGRYLPAARFEDVANPTRFQCHSRVAERYRSGRVLLAGDAAHVCTPAQGHGMNSGIQDAFNLAWKLALVCQGHGSDTLLDSYEAERRPVAEAFVASGDAAEESESVTGAAERRARDEMLRKVFADPEARHHEAIAEAELDIDYGGSPIVMGDRHEALAPGQRLPDSIEVNLPGGECLLHEMTFRAGHTALLIGGLATTGDRLLDTELTLRHRGAAPFVEATLMVTAQSRGPDQLPRIAPGAAKQLGIDGLTLLLVRPDGYVGLRADRDPLAALAAYEARLHPGPT